MWPKSSVAKEEEERAGAEQDRRQGPVSRPDSLDGDEHQEHEQDCGQYGAEEGQLPEATAVVVPGRRLGRRLLEADRPEPEICRENREREPGCLVAKYFPPM